MSDYLLGILVWAFIAAFAGMIIYATGNAIIGLMVHPNLPDLLIAVGGVLYLGQWLYNHLETSE